MRGDDADTEAPEDGLAQARALEVPGPSDAQVLADCERAGVSLYRGRRIFGGCVAALVSVGLCAGVLDCGAERGLAHARSRAYDCVDAVDAGRLDSCSVGLRPLSRVWPSTRGDAARIRLDHDYEVDQRRLARAVRLELDPAREAEIIDELILDEHAIRMHEALGNHCYSPSLLSVLANDGAHQAVLDHDLNLPHGAHDRPELVARSALLLGKPRAAAAAWARASVDDLDLEGHALLCLEREDSGLALLSRYYITRQEQQSDEGERIRAKARRSLMEVACASKRGLLRDLDGEAWIAAHEATKGWASASAWLDAHRDNPARAQVIAQAVQVEGAEREQMLEWLGEVTLEHEPDPLRLRHRLSLLRAGRGEVVLRHADRLTNTYDPQAMADAAWRLASWADEEAARAKSAPRRRERELATARAASLRRGAAVMADEAALEWIGRGQDRLALRLARAARAWHVREREWIAVGLIAQAGDPTAALAWTEARRAELLATDEPSGTRLRDLEDLELRALGMLGRWREALTLARSWRPAREPHTPDDDHLQLWICALELQLDELGEPQAMCYPRWGGEALEALVLPLRAEALAQDYRVGLYRPVAPETHLPDLQTVLVAGQAHDPDRAERWLDLALPWDEQLGRELLWARAEAARWRGDVDSESLWRSRLRELQARTNTEERALLLHLAGI